MLTGCTAREIVYGYQNPARHEVLLLLDTLESENANFYTMSLHEQTLSLNPAHFLGDVCE